MLTPDELLRISEGAEEIAEELHQDILNRIIERILIRIGRGDDYILTAIDKWQIELLQDAGYLLEDIQKAIAKRTPYLQTEIAEAMEDAGVRAISYDNAIYKAAGLSPLPLEQSPALIRIMQRNYEATLGELANFTGTMATAAQQAYIQACDKAYNQVLSGSLSYTQAVREAVMELVGNGVTVTYPSGHTDTIEAAVRRAVRTGVSQASGQITEARMEEMEWDIILVSSHLGARVTDKADYTDHAWWQGKFYSKSGKDSRFPPFSVCGLGKVQGIHGANCRHSHGPGDGENNPFEQYDSEENRKAYELQQRQNTLERRIRNTKREVMGLDTARQNAEGDLKDVLEADYQRKAALLQKQNSAYNAFCKEHDLKKRSDRISIAQWDRKQAAQARAAAKKYQVGLDNPQKSGIMKIDTGGQRNEKPLSGYQIAKAEEAARKQGYTGEIFYRDTSSTAFHGSVDGKSFHYLVIGTDAYPVRNPKDVAIEKVSLNGCMAHEIVGHYEAWKKGTTQSNYHLEEAQASIRASKFGVDLTDEERAVLFEDAMDRLRKAGLSYEDVKNELDIWGR